ncbi:MAG TPA: hypothetical protein VKE94_19390 [Gemmataceae bacterium]|nr:hypothetical protein [Gemmataceae bacterium]
MKMKTVVLLVLAVILGTAASRYSKRLLSGTAEQHPDSSPEPVVVLTAKEPLAAGTVLREPDRLFDERTAIANEATARAVHRLHLLRGRRLVKPIDAHAVVTTDYLIDEEGAGLDVVKREGRQAIAIAVQPLGGQLFLPQSRVDVIWTASSAATESRIVARDLPLLGLQTRDGRTIATVSAKPADTEKQGQAATQGTLQLVRTQSR